MPSSNSIWTHDLTPKKWRGAVNRLHVLGVFTAAIFSAYVLFLYIHEAATVGLELNWLGIAILLIFSWLFFDNTRKALLFVSWLFGWRWRA